MTLKITIDTDERDDHVVIITPKGTDIDTLPASIKAALDIVTEALKNKGLKYTIRTEYITWKEYKDLKDSI